MKRIAVFVEGYTEQEFIIKVISEIAGARGVTFDLRQQYKGLVNKVAMRSANNPELYVLIVNCCTDSQVKSQIQSQYESLSKNGYRIIIGLRDLHPLDITELATVKKYLPHNIPTKGAPVAQFIAITETEAWFLEEHSHYQRLHPDMTVEEIKVKAGIDLATCRGHDFVNPAKVLETIYSHWGVPYKKKRTHINTTIEALSAEEIYMTVRGKATSLDEVITCIENALFQP